MDSLPEEIISYILYTLKGLEHPTVNLIKNYMTELGKEKKCFVCNQKNIGEALVPQSYIEEHQFIYIKKKYLENNKKGKVYACYGCCH